MDAIELLRRQHQELERLVAQILESGDEHAARAAFSDFTDRLTAHVVAEEKLFYPALRNPRTEELLLDSVEEHLSIRRLLADLLELEVDDPSFRAKLRVLREQAEHHHRQEEERLFPKAFKLLDPIRRQTLGEAILELQRELSTPGELRARMLAPTGAR